MNQSKTILYVEDDPVLLATYRQLFERAGFSVELARDGLTAMRTLLRLVPDLVVLDLMLPRFDGGEVLKFMQSNPRLKNVPVIILSTNSIVDADEEYVLENARRRFIKGRCSVTEVMDAVQKSLAEVPAGGTAAADASADNGQPKQLVKTAA